MLNDVHSHLIIIDHRYCCSIQGSHDICGRSWCVSNNKVIIEIKEAKCLTPQDCTAVSDTVSRKFLREMCVWGASV